MRSGDDGHTAVQRHAQPDVIQEMDISASGRQPAETKIQNYILVEPRGAQDDGGIHVSDWFPAIPSVVSSLLAVYIVHRLTKSREREKAVYEQYTVVSRLCLELGEAAIQAWTDRPSNNRNRKDAEVLWRAQQLGAAVQRLKKMSARRRWEFVGIIPVPASSDISVGDELVAYRQALTLDPFMDPRRPSNRGRAQAVESAKGTFLIALDNAVSKWAS